MKSKIKKRIEDYKSAIARATAEFGPPPRVDAAHDDGFIAGLEVALSIVDKYSPALEAVLHDLETTYGLWVYDAQPEGSSEAWQINHPSIIELRNMLGSPKSGQGDDPPADLLLYGFCPRCGATYRSDMTKCIVCGDALPELGQGDNDE